MFKSKVVAYVKPSSSCTVVLILGMGYGLRTMHLLSSLKSNIVCTMWSFLGIMKEGEAHSYCYQAINLFCESGLVYFWDRVWPVMVQLSTFF
jgi:hypothetical protein